MFDGGCHYPLPLSPHLAAASTLYLSYPPRYLGRGRCPYLMVSSLKHLGLALKPTSRSSAQVSSHFSRLALGSQDLKPFNTPLSHLFKTIVSSKSQPPHCQTPCLWPSQVTQDCSCPNQASLAVKTPMPDSHPAKLFDSLHSSNFRRPQDQALPPNLLVQTHSVLVSYSMRNTFCMFLLHCNI